MDKDSKHHDEPSEDEGMTSPPVAVMPDGLPAFQAAGVGQPTPVPERTPENFICLRGPCKHYWYLETMSQAGNPADTWEALGLPVPRQRHYTCLVNTGFETSFGDDNAYECNKWEPYLLSELLSLKARRDQWKKEQDNDQ